MPILRRTMALLLAASLALPVAAGCGGPSDPDESSWRREVDSSLESLQGSEAFRYRIHLETWVGVSGQSVYGDEKGDGAYAAGEYSVSITRTSPAGEESLAIAYLDDQMMLQENGVWRLMSADEAPSPLYDPQHFIATVHQDELKLVLYLLLRDLLDTLAIFFGGDHLQNAVLDKMP